MADKEKSEPKTATVPKDRRVVVKDKKGNYARPLEKHLKAWLDKGWTVVDSADAG